MTFCPANRQPCPGSSKRKGVGGIEKLKGLNFDVRVQLVLCWILKTLSGHVLILRVCGTLDHNRNTVVSPTVFPKPQRYQDWY